MITERLILNLLAERHKEDVFVPGCKTGATQMRGSFQQLDAWAMKKSWARPWTYGYEIKVRRSDFLRDDKWTNYLRYCTHFAFVCPPKLIDPAELPAEVGLIFVTKTGTRLYTKRKPAPRDVEVPQDLFRYVLMWRSKIARQAEQAEQKRGAEWWAAWIEERRQKKDLGQKLGRMVAVTMREELERRDSEIRKLRMRLGTLERRAERYRDARLIDLPAILAAVRRGQDSLSAIEAALESV